MNNLRTLEIELFNTLIQPVYLKWGGTLGGHDKSLSGLGHGITLNVANDNVVLISYRLYKNDSASFDYDCVEVGINLSDGNGWDTSRFYSVDEFFKEEMQYILESISELYNLD